MAVSKGLKLVSHNAFFLLSLLIFYTLSDWGLRTTAPFLGWTPQHTDIFIGFIDFLLSLVLVWCLAPVVILQLNNLHKNEAQAEPFQLFLSIARHWGGEYLMMIFQVLVRLLCLVIPGIVQMVRFTFVPFVVLLHPKSKDPSFNNLKHAESLTKGRFWWLLSISLVIFAIEITIDSLEYLLPQLSLPWLCLFRGIGFVGLQGLVLAFWFPFYQKWETVGED